MTKGRYYVRSSISIPIIIPLGLLIIDLKTKYVVATQAHSHSIKQPKKQHKTKQKQRNTAARSKP